MTVYYSVGILSPTFISWNDKNFYFGVESEIDKNKRVMLLFYFFIATVYTGRYRTMQGFLLAESCGDLNGEN